MTEQSRQEYDSYSLNLNNIISHKQLPSIIRALAADTMEIGGAYAKIGSWLKTLHNTDLDACKKMLNSAYDEIQRNNQGVQNAVTENVMFSSLLIAILRSREGLEPICVGTFNRDMAWMTLFVCGEILSRQQLITINHDLLTFSEDTDEDTFFTTIGGERGDAAFDVLNQYGDLPPIFTSQE